MDTAPVEAPVAPELLEACRADLRAAREQVAAALAERRAGGRAAARALTDAVDRTILRLLPGGVPAGMAIVALGGTGRREVCPHSDVDLLFLSADPEHGPWRATTAAVLHGLWALDLKVGHASRTLDECIALSEEDPATATTHWDARLVAGDGRLAEALLRRTDASVAQRRDELLRELDELTRTRHDRYGGSVYMLEPNLKLGVGTLRDVHTARWVMRALLGDAEPLTLAARGALPWRTARELEGATDFLLLARTALHLEASWKTDRLGYEHQDRVAAALGLLTPAGDPDVPALLSTFYRHAHAVAAATLRLLERRQAGRGAGGNARQPVAPGWVRNDDHLVLDDPSLLEREPRAVVRSFRRARELGLRLHPETQELILAASGRISGILDDPEITDALFDALMAEDDGQTLFLMHELGVLTATIPEMRHVTALFQRNPFHVYTVDVHTLVAVRQLHRLRAGALAEQHPTLAAIARRHAGSRIVPLAVLLHDIGKGLGGDHCERALAVLPQIGARLGLTAAELGELSFLVRHHIDMALLSQHRDLSDQEMVRDFARQAGTLERLDHLYLVTFADMSSVNPALLTAWKATLLEQLHALAADALTRGLDLYDDPQERVDRVREEVLRLRFGEVPDHPDRRTVEVEHFFGGLPTRYFETTAPETIVHHMDLVARQVREQLVLELRPDPDREEVEATLVCRDTPGLLACLAGVMALRGVSIRTAAITSRSDGVALDVLRLADPHGRLAKDTRRWDAIRKDLHREVLTPSRAHSERVEAELARSLRQRRPIPTAQAEVGFDNDVSRDYTVIDVTALDFVGLLFRVARTLSRFGLGIELAMVDTQGPLARDAFYVRYHTGEKVLSAAAQRQVRAALLAALEPPGR